MNIERYAQSTELGQEVPKGSAGTRAACVDSVSAAKTGRSVLMFCGIHFAISNPLPASTAAGWIRHRPRTQSEEAPSGAASVPASIS